MHHQGTTRPCQANNAAASKVRKLRQINNVPPEALELLAYSARPYCAWGCFAKMLWPPLTGQNAKQTALEADDYRIFRIA